MKDEVKELVSALCRPDVGDEALDALCAAACAKLDGMMAEGVTAADCAEAYLPAAAWLVMDWLKDGRGVTAFSAGDMTVRMDSTQGRLEQQALRLMAPWLKDKNFVFRGVMG